MGHRALDLVQVRSSTPPPEPRHDQVDDPPHEPAIFPELVPVAQENCVVLLQDPFTSRAHEFEAFDEFEA